MYTRRAGPLLDLEFMIHYFLFDFNGVDTTHDRLAWRACLACLPSWGRFAQCLRRYYDEKPENRTLHPHLTNAGKYSTTFLVVILSTLAKSTKHAAILDDDALASDGIFDDDATRSWTILWGIAVAVNICYTLYWDLIMDWGACASASTRFGGRHSPLWPPTPSIFGAPVSSLVECSLLGCLTHLSPSHMNARASPSLFVWTGLFRKDAKHRFLRDQLMYPVWAYYAAIAFDVFGRCAGSLKLLLIFTDLVDGIYVGSVLAVVEILRRFVWNHFRFENEHLNNCGECLYHLRGLSLGKLPCGHLQHRKPVFLRPSLQH